MATKSNALILIIVLVSFLGFITENIFIFFRTGIIDNRNMIFPSLLGYGLAIMAIYKLFGTPNSPMLFGKELNFQNNTQATLYYFIIAFLCVSIGELILGHVIEWTCNIEWWNYSSIPLHITQYTSVPTSVAFGAFITLFMKHLFSPMLNKFCKMNPQLLSVLSISMIVLLSIDFIHSGIYMFKNQKTLQLWNIDLGQPIKEMIENSKKSR